MTPVALIGEDVDDVIFIFPLIIETTDGCFSKDDDVEVKRQAGEIVDEDDDDEPVTGVLII